MYTESERNKFDKIKLIKLFRVITGLGLVDAKLATELWLEAYCLRYANEAYEIAKFTRFACAFASDKIKIADGRIVHAAPNGLTRDQIKGF